MGQVGSSFADLGQFENREAGPGFAVFKLPPETVRYNHHICNTNTQ
jgi:hypothetical protein